MTSGSGPMRGRLAAYKAGQPPRTANRAAMPDNVSPGRTTYLVAGRAVTDAAATLIVLAGVTWVVLPAMRVSAWAGRAGPVMQAAATMTVRMLQASTAHADFAGTLYSIGQLAGTPSWPASSPYGTSGSTRRATRKISPGSAPGGRST